MIKSYLKTAVAHLIRNKTYSFISILSLTIGLAVCILLLLYVRIELSFDRFNKNADNIYRLCNPEHPCHSPQTSKFLADNIPEIKSYTRILPRVNEIIAYKEKRFKENRVAFTDASFFSIFSFKFRQGNPENALLLPLTVVISEKTAHKYFGNEDPIGKVLKLNNEANYTITGVMDDMPGNSHFRYDMILTLSGTDKEAGMDNWGWQNFLVYFLFPDHFSKTGVEAKCNSLMKTVKDPNNLPSEYSLQPLNDIHLYSSHFKADIQPQNSILYVMIFSAIAFLVLLISCFNYINLFTASASTRVVEIGMRKACGASRRQLAAQYIFESFVMVAVSFVLSFLLVVLSLPLFNELSGKDLSILALIDTKSIFGILGILLLVGVLAGWYPAFVLSSYNPVRVFQSSKNTGANKFQFRKILVGAQFTIVIVLITVSIVMFRQIRFLQYGNLGFDKEYVLVSEIGNFGNEGKYLALKRALLDQASVLSVSAASRVPSEDLNNMGAVKPRGQKTATRIAYVHVHFDYFNTLNIKAVKGRVFSNAYKTDSSEALILNEAAVKSLGIQGDPVGQPVKCNWPRSERKIVGIVGDFHFESLYEKIKPAVFVIDFNECGELLVKVQPSGVSNSIGKISEICKAIYPDQVFDFHLLDRQLEQLYQSDEKRFHLMGYFTLLAILLACMGLFAVASFIITSRTKEIGIRKVNGARVSEIMQMLNLSFMKWIGIAFVIATPLAWFVMSGWLSGFAYRISLSWWIFALTGFISCMITMITIGFQSYRAATANPVKTLKTE
jgi:putative ABC transport system permease protein